MSELVILLPPRPRDGAPAEVPADLAFVLSADGRTVSRQGRAEPAQLPRATSVVAVLPDDDVSWHRVTVPKAPPARLRAALGSVLEDRLLDDDDSVHLAVEPGVAPGHDGWVAAMPRAWLARLLAQLEGAGLVVDRVLPLSAPLSAPSNLSAGPQGGADADVHALPVAEAPDNPLLVWRGGDGVASFRLAGNLSRQRAAACSPERLRCTAHPAAAAAAEQWLGRPVAVLGDAERALQALSSPWNLRQFDLAPSHRGLQAVRAGLRQLAAPVWRPLRLGLVALLLLNLLGLNLWAWHLDQSVSDRRQSLVRLLQATHPQVRSIIDAPAQMQRETDRLRAAAGRAGPDDLEPLLAAVSSAWPDGVPAAAQLRFETGRLSVAAPAWPDAQRLAFAERVRSAGYQADPQGDQLVITRGGSRP